MTLPPQARFARWAVKYGPLVMPYAKKLYDQGRFRQLALMHARTVEDGMFSWEVHDGDRVWVVWSGDDVVDTYPTLPARLLLEDPFPNAKPERRIDPDDLPTPRARRRIAATSLPTLPGRRGDDEGGLDAPTDDAPGGEDLTVEEDPEEQ